MLTRLRDTRLKVNPAKSLFCAHVIEYLGYILTREGIKPQPKEVQAILALNLPNNVKELRHFLGMVQYYRDMWARCSEMLAPLTNLVGECGEKKNHQNEKDQEKPLTVGSNLSTGVCQRKDCYSKRDSLSLSRLFEALWDLHICLLNSVGSHDHTG